MSNIENKEISSMNDDQIQALLEEYVLQRETMVHSNKEIQDKFDECIPLASIISSYQDEDKLESKSISVNEKKGVSDHTLVLTIMGYFPISTLYTKYKGKSIRCWNGNSFSSFYIRKNDTKSDIFRVYLSNGLYLDCTSDHEWLLVNGNRVKTSELKPDDELAHYMFPVIDRKTHGKFTYEDGLNWFKTPKCPFGYSSILNKLEWLEGLQEAIATQSLYTCNTHITLHYMQILLSTLGIRTELIYGYTHALQNWIMFSSEDHKRLNELGYKIPRVKHITDSPFDNVKISHICETRYDTNTYYMESKTGNEPIVYEGVLTL